MLPFLRSLLFVPANRPKMLDKAPISGADALVLDLEDSVPPHEKAVARQMVRDRIGALSGQHPIVLIRVNAVTTGLVAEDIAAAVTRGLAGLVLPKVLSIEELRSVERLVGDAERHAGLPIGQVAVVAELETAGAVLNAQGLACAGYRLAGMSLGAEDFCADMGIPRTKDGKELFVPRATISLCCHAADIQALDCVFADFSDEAGLRQEASEARALGYTGKFVIHPKQVGPVNDTFTPSPSEIDYARRVIEASEAGQASGTAAVSLDGKMIDTPVVKRARRLVSLAKRLEKEPRE